MLSGANFGDCQRLRHAILDPSHRLAEEANGARRIIVVHMKRARVRRVVPFAKRHGRLTRPSAPRQLYWRPGLVARAEERRRLGRLRVRGVRGGMTIGSKLDGDLLLSMYGRMLTTQL